MNKPQDSNRRYMVRIGHRGYENNSIMRATTLLFSFDPELHACPVSQAFAEAKDYCARQERRLVSMLACPESLQRQRGVVDAG
jgi:hypothetical protein